MFVSVYGWLLLSLLWIPTECRLQEHRKFTYNSMVDGRGTYNFAYDTSHQPSDAHSMHMEYRDANGIVRGRYGYTDPRGNLRVVEYEAGPDGYKARGDVGPDMFPHMEAPGLAPAKPNPVLTPLRMSGWDPVRNPINERVVTENEDYTSYSPDVKRPRRDYVKYIEQNQVYTRKPSQSPVSQPAYQSPVSQTSYQSPVSQTTYKYPLSQTAYQSPVSQTAYKYPLSQTAYKYPLSQTAYIPVRHTAYKSPVSQAVDPDAEIFQHKLTQNEKKSKPLTQSQPLTIYNIDVDPDEIRVAGPPVPVQRRTLITSSADVYPQRGREIIATSPGITYYERSPRRRLSQINHYDDSYYPKQGTHYHSYSKRTQLPRQLRYHGRQYHYE